MRARRCLLLLALLLVPGGAAAQPYGFVTSAAENRVAVLDLGNDTLVGSFPLGGLPSGAALNANGSQLYVTRTQANALAKINTQSGATITIPVGARPAAVWVDPFPLGGLVWVAATGADAVSAVSPTGNLVVGTVAVGDAPIAVTGYPGRAYVANWGDGTVSVIDTLTSGFPVVGTVSVGRAPAGLMLDPVAGRLYVANFVDNTVSVVNTTSLAVTATVPVCRRPRGLAGAAGRLYVACFDDSRIDIVDTATNTVVLDGPSGGTNPIDLHLGPGQRLYVTHLQTGKGITVLDAATLVPLRAIDAPVGAVGFAGFANQAPPAPSESGFGRSIPSAVADMLGRATRPRSKQRTPVYSFGDSTLALGDWEVRDPVGNQVTTQEAQGLDHFRRTVHFQSGSSHHRYTNAVGVVDPAVWGPVNAVRGGWFRRVASPGALVRESLLVFQDDRTYRSTVSASFTSGAWESYDIGPLHASSFEDGAGGHPNFGANGSPLTFGYRRETVDGTLPMAHDLDDFFVQVYLAGIPAGGALELASDEFDTAVERVPYVITVRRVGGAQGDVGVRLRIQHPDMAQEKLPLSWADGDASPREVIRTFHLNPDDTFRTALVDLSDPTGPAIIGDPDTTIVTVEPAGLSGPLFVLLETVKALAAGFSPAWLLALAGPAVVMARRRRRGQGRSRPIATPASTPDSEP